MTRKLRNLPLLISGLSAVALGTVGFSTWIFNYEVKTDEVKTTVTVDGSSDKLISLTTTVKPSNQTIKLGENTNSTKGNSLDNGAHATDETDFTIEIDASIRVSKDYLLEKELPTKITYSYATGFESFFSTNVDATYRSLAYPGVTSWEYIDLPKDSLIDIKKTDLNKITSSNPTFTSSNGWVAKKYQDYDAYIISKSLTLEFSWGNYFEKKAPTEFYPYYYEKYVKNKFIEIYDEFALAQFYNEATVELNSMYKQVGNGSEKPLKLSATIN